MSTANGAQVYVTRAEKGEAIRKAVLAKTFSMVSKYGIPGIKMHLIAKHVGLSVGGLYRYYPGKSDILVDLEKETIFHYSAYLEQRLVTAEELIDKRRGRSPALARLVSAGMAYLQHATDWRARHYLLDLFLSTPHVLFIEEEALDIERVLTPIIARCSTLFEAAVGARALAPGDATVRTFCMWATVHGADHFRKRDRLVERHLHGESIARASIDALLVGWGADPVRLREAHAILGS